MAKTENRQLENEEQSTKLTYKSKTIMFPNVIQAIQGKVSLENSSPCV